MESQPDDKDATAAKGGRDDKPVLPEKSDDERGVGWGDAPEPDDEERLRADRPPHWDR